MPLRFWFLVTLSAFLTITFAGYLPLRFLYQATTGEHIMAWANGKDTPSGMMGENGVEHAHTDAEAMIFHDEEKIHEGLVVNLNTSPVPVTTGTTTRLDFFVNEKPGNVSVPVDTLDITHTKPIHVIGVRTDLEYFFHIHPDVFPTEHGGIQSRADEPVSSPVTQSPQSLKEIEDYWTEERMREAKPMEMGIPPLTSSRSSSPGILSSYYTFTAPGVYRIWSEVTYKGVAHVIRHPALTVSGMGPRETPPRIASRIAQAAGHTVELTAEGTRFVKGHPTDISFVARNRQGAPIFLEEYLGEPMHLVIIKDDLEHFIHAHPEDPGDSHAAAIIPRAFAHGGVADGDAESGPAPVNFHVTFPESGWYRAFAQFRPLGTPLNADEAITASFWIEVEERAVSDAMQWWGLLLVGGIAIVVLSIAVSRFLRAKATAQ